MVLVETWCHFSHVDRVSVHGQRLAGHNGRDEDGPIPCVAFRVLQTVGHGSLRGAQIDKLTRPVRAAFPDGHPEAGSNAREHTIGSLQIAMPLQSFPTGHANLPAGGQGSPDMNRSPECSPIVVSVLGSRCRNPNLVRRSAMTPSVTRGRALRYARPKAPRAASYTTWRNRHVLIRRLLRCRMGSVAPALRRGPIQIGAGRRHAYRPQPVGFP